MSYDERYGERYDERGDDETSEWDSRRVRETERNRREEEEAERARRRRALKRKGRFRRFILWLLFVGIVSSLLAVAGWLLANDLCAFNKMPHTATVEITKDDDLDSVAVKLKEAGLIEYGWFFKIFGRIRNAESKIGIGSYELDTTMDYNALISGMRNRNAALNSGTVRVAVPEGYNTRQIFALLEKYGVSTAEALEDAAANYNFGYTFLDGGRKGSAVRLEGYLFPDTYEFYVGQNAATALAKFLSNFSNKMDAELMAQVEASGYTLDQIITIASLIEKETDGTDRAKIASVIYNRLNNTGETYNRLEIDAAVIYGLGDSFSGRLTESDLAKDTPYNLRIHEGLPPTPIANPGLASIEAALEPAETNYYFYALGTDGVHHFFSSYDAFVEFVNSSQYAG